MKRREERVCQCWPLHLAGKCRKQSHLRCIALHCVALHCVALHCAALHCVLLRCIAVGSVECSLGVTVDPGGTAGILHGTHPHCCCCCLLHSVAQWCLDWTLCSLTLLLLTEACEPWSTLVMYISSLFSHSGCQRGQCFTDQKLAVPNSLWNSEEGDCQSEIAGWVGNHKYELWSQ